MKNDQRFVQTFFGGAVGGLVGYIVSELIIEAILDFEEGEEDNDENQEDIDEEELNPVEEKIVMSQLKRKKEKEPKEKMVPIKYDEYFKKNRKPTLEELSENKVEAQVVEEAFLAPFPLTYTQSLTIPEGYQEVYLRYYKQSDVLVDDETDEVILDYDYIVGSENLTLFGHMDHEADRIAVQNDERKTVYFIRKTGAKEVFETNDPEPFEKMNNHNNIDDDDDDEEEDDYFEEEDK